MVGNGRQNLPPKAVIIRRRIRGLGADPSIVKTLADAITRQENVNPAYHNPGGLIAGPGCTSRPGQIAICPDDATGRADLERQVGIDIDRGWNLSDLINSWAPAQCGGSLCTGNNPSVYTQNVSQWTGFPTDVPLNALDSSASGGSWDTVDNLSLPSSDLLPSDSSGWLWAGVALVGALVVVSVID